MHGAAEGDSLFGKEEEVMSRRGSAAPQSGSAQGRAHDDDVRAAHD